MNGWRGYWGYWGIAGGLFQAFMAAVIIVSGTVFALGMVASMVYLVTS